MAITPISPNFIPLGVSTDQIGAAVRSATPNPSPTAGVASPTVSGSGSAANGSDFPGLLKNLLGQLNGLAQQADATATQAALGQDVDLHQLMMSMETASLGFDLGVQVRNRLLEAYQEITRMQV